MDLKAMRSDLARRSKKGLSFIMASILLWTGILVVWLLPVENTLTRNLLTFFCTAPLMPLAFLLSKVLKAEFSAKGNPLNELGIIFSLNQLLYILIAMWVYAAAPTKMVMILGMIFGAHLLPFAWLYQSPAYFIMSIIIPFTMLIVGHNLPEQRVFVLAGIMICLEAIFAVWLGVEMRSQETQPAINSKKSA